MLRLQLVEELAGAATELSLDPVDLRVQLIEEEHRRNRDAETEGGLDERFGDTGRHGAEAAGARRRDPLERGDDADDRAEETDEGRDRSDGGEDAHSAAKLDADRLFLTLRLAVRE